MYSCFHLVLLSLLWSLVEVHSQTFPFVSFMSQTLANHSYVDLSQVGNDLSGSDSVQCHTDLSTCCTNTQGSHRGDWYFPDGTRLPILGGGDIYEQRVVQRVDLRRRNNANSPTGIYRCDIPTNAVHDGSDISVRDTPVYVGLYTASGGDVSISGGVTFDPSQLTLTCISAGGPATTVTWTRDSTTVTQGTQTVLNNPVTAQYTHTLTVTTGGEYTCTVANNKPSSASATITVTGTGPPTNVAARQTNPTSILVEWTPSSDATGYTIHYDSSEGPSGSVSIDGDSTNSYTLENLQNGETYTISIVATSANLPSQVVTAGMAVGLVPGNSELVQSSTSTDSITISVGFPAGSVVDSYVVMWTSVECSDNGMMTVDGSPATYTIMGLEEGISYNITVRASNNAGSGNSTSITARTNEAAPNGAPNSVTEVSAAPNSITVGWEEVDCLLRNGVITGYTAQALRNRMVKATANVGGDARQATISGLIPLTEYSVKVAAVNNAGKGSYSSPITIMTTSTLVSVPEKPTIDMDSIDTTSTTITISWSLPPDVTGSEVSWELTEQTRRRQQVRNAKRGSSGPLPADQNSYTIGDLRSGTSYDITVTVFNPAGSSSTTFTRSTEGGVIDANQAESTSNTSAIIGGVVAVAVAFMIITSLTVIVVVILVLRSRSGNYSAKTRATVGATNQSVELSKLSEPTFADQDQFQTTSNEAYNVVRGTGRTVEDDYEVPQNLPPSTASQQPTTIATGDYELV